MKRVCNIGSGAKQHLGRHSYSHCRKDKTQRVRPVTLPLVTGMIAEKLHSACGWSYRLIVTNALSGGNTFVTLSPPSGCLAHEPRRRQQRRAQGDPTGSLLYPVCFLDSSELRLRW